MLYRYIHKYKYILKDRYKPEDKLICFIKGYFLPCLDCRKYKLGSIFSTINQNWKSINQLNFV